ncbi:hypothetical protein Tco_1304466 [Tanacetum coccineum]
MVVETRKRKASGSSSKSPSVKVAPPKKLKLSTRRTKSVATTSSSTSRLGNKTPVPLSITGGTFTTPDWLPDGLTMVVSAKATGEKFKVELAPPQKEQVSTTSTKPLEIPERLYDLIQNAARVRKSLKLNSNNRSAKRKLESLESDIHVVSTCCKFITEDLPTDWIYDPETSMAHVPKPPTSPKPKTEKKKKKKTTRTKEIQITWSSPNYHGKYPLKNDELEVWNLFRRTENAVSESCTKTYLLFPDVIYGCSELTSHTGKTFKKNLHQILFTWRKNYTKSDTQKECCMEIKGSKKVQFQRGDTAHRHAKLCEDSGSWSKGWVVEREEYCAYICEDRIISKAYFMWIICCRGHKFCFPYMGNEPLFTASVEKHVADRSRLNLKRADQFPPMPIFHHFMTGTLFGLPQELYSVHDTFHVSNLKKCLADPTLQIPLEEIQVNAKLNFVEELVEILEREIKKR